MIHEPVLTRSRAKRRPSPLFVQPLLPTLVDEPPDGVMWEHEIKFDGYRTLIVNRDGDGRTFTRTELYQPVVAAAGRLAKSATLDGEMIVQGEDGRCDFAGLRSAIEREPGRLVFMAFDLLSLGGVDMRGEPLWARRERLEALVGSHDPASPIEFSQALPGSGGDMLEAACRLGLEGIVSKKLSSRNHSGRQTSWLKSKCYDEGDFVVVGAEHEPGKPAFALLARETEAGLEYAGSAFLTLAGEERDRFWNAIEQHGRSKPPVRMPKGKARWINPVLRVHVEHLKGPGKLHHATVREIIE